MPRIIVYVPADRRHPSRAGAPALLGKGPPGLAEQARDRGWSITTGWQSFRRNAARADCAVLVLEWLRHAEELAAVESWERWRGAARPPTVVLTRRDPEGLRHLGRLLAEEVVYWDELEQELPSALARVFRGEALRRLAREVTASRRLSARLRGALARTLLAFPPFKGVEDLAEAEGVGAGALYYHWKRSGLAEQVSLKDFLSLLLLHKAVTRKPSRSWERVAHELRVSKSALERAGRRLLDRSLSEFANEPDLASRRVEAVLRSAVH